MVPRSMLDQGSAKLNPWRLGWEMIGKFALEGHLAQRCYRLK